MTSAELMILIKARDEASAVLKNVASNASSLGDKMGTALKVGALAAGGALVGAGFALKGFVEDAMASQEVMAQTNAVLASTHGAAGMSADAIADLANELSRFTPYDDEAIQSAENLLLTFTSIGKDVFPQATETVLNMSTALGQDLKSSAIQLGKAMNDPITGATALRRVGVALTEQQMDQIKAFQESGDLLSAQKIIMGELTTEFGGSAKAAGDTFAGKMKILNTQIGNVKESIGMALLPMLTKLADLAIKYVVPAIQDGAQALQDFVGTISAALSGDVGKAAELFNKLPGPLQQIALWLAKNRDAIQDFLASAGEIAKSLFKQELEGWKKIITELGPKLVEFGKFLMEHKPLLIALAVAVGVLLIVFASVPIAIATIIIAGGLLAAHWDDIKAKVLELWASFKENFGLIYLVVVYYFESIKNEVTTAINVVRDIINIVMALLHGDWGAAWQGVKDLVGDIWDGIITDIGLKAQFLVDAVIMVITALPGMLQGLAGAFYGAASALGSAILDGFRDALSNTAGVASDVAGAVLQAIRSVVNVMINRINSALEFTIVMPGSIPNIHIDPPDIPQFARGIAYVPQDMLAVIHRGERVVPASENRPGAMGGAGTTIVNNYIDKVELHGDPQSGLSALGVMV